MAANITRTKAYKSLIALGASADEAKALLEAKAKAATPKPTVDFDALAKELGLTVEQVKAALSQGVSEPAAKPSKGEDLVEAGGYSYTKGRVYLTDSMLAAAARVLKTGTPEIAQTSGKGHIAAVLLVRHEDTGDVSAQNLSKG